MFEPLPPVSAAHLLREVDEALIPLLRSLEADDWDKPAVGSWAVRDVAAHLLDGALRRLSLDRDRHRPPPTDHDLADYQGLVGFLNELNATWVAAAGRLSPQVITDLLAHIDPQVADYLESLDPNDTAAFPVSWAGEDESRVWMDVAREFTERWHHQQQIRETVGVPSLDERRYIEPLLETFARALPRAYDSLQASDGSTILIEITDFDGLAWVLYRADGSWQLGQPTSELEADASIRLPSDIAWRLFIKAISGEAAMDYAELAGEARLTGPFFEALAVMA
jgi:uncharacterized protein (TIGR03083 family)